MPHYRLYIDESGDHTYNPDPHAMSRYLGLMGVLIENDYYRSTLHPRLSALKQAHFPHNPDDAVILVRAKIIGRKGAFKALQDPAKDAVWGKEFLEFLSDSQMTLFAVVIDKVDHLARYGKSAYHPYHYSLTVLLERLRGWLDYCGGTADVMAESRGTKEDKELKDTYRELWTRGTYYIPASEFQKVLTSNDIKVRKKDANISGLQIADLLAAPAKLDILSTHGRLPGGAGGYTGQVCKAMSPKFNKYGRVFLD